MRITTNLVQVDAVITDKSGKPITDLKPQELQLYEDKHFVPSSLGGANVCCRGSEGHFSQSLYRVTLRGNCES